MAVYNLKETDNQKGIGDSDYRVKHVEKPAIKPQAKIKKRNRKRHGR